MENTRTRQLGTLSTVLIKLATSEPIKVKSGEAEREMRIKSEAIRRDRKCAIKGTHTHTYTYTWRGPDKPTHNAGNSGPKPDNYSATFPRSVFV